MSEIFASVKPEQISVSVSGDSVTATVSGGIGPSGDAGSAGQAATIAVGTVTTGAPGSSASVVNAGTSGEAVLNFTIPAGATGATGPQGERGLQGVPGTPGAAGAAGQSATVSVGTVTTGAAGSSASVTNVGTPSAAVLNFTIPAGAAGATGAQGSAGAAGAAGAAATVSVGTVTTGAAGSSASVSNVGSSSAAILNFTIPAGATGAQGQQGVAGAAGAKGDKGDQGDTGVVSATSPLLYNSGTKTVSLGNSGVTAGTYSSVTVNAQGLVTAGGTHSVSWSDVASKPTTLSGFGITDAATSTHAHGNLTNDGKVGSASGRLVSTSAGGAIAATQYPAVTVGQITFAPDSVDVLFFGDNSTQSTAWTGSVDASAITTGTIDTARLGSGSASGSTYLAGDSTWKAISAGSSPEQLLAVSCAAGQVLTGNDDNVILFDTADLDPESGFDLETGAYTVPSGKGGLYLASVSIIMSGFDNQEAYNLRVVVNGSDSYWIVMGGNGMPDGYVRANNTTPLFLSAEDAVQVVAYPATDSPEVYADAASTYLKLFRIG